MLYGLLLTLYIIVCLFMVLIILIQKGKSSIGIGGLGGGNQLLFGGSGGQDIFQKMTWFLVAFFLISSLGLALYKTSQKHNFKYIQASRTVAAPQPLTGVTPSPDLSRSVAFPQPTTETPSSK